MRLYGQDVSTGTERGVVVPVGGYCFSNQIFAEIKPNSLILFVI